MTRRFWTRSMAPLLALTLFGAACGDDDDSGEAADTTEADGSATTTGGDTDTTEASGGESSGLLPDNGPCDESLDPYPVATVNVFESPVLTLGEDVAALEASVEAFNARGGVGGHCFDLTTCDSGGDPNAEVDCARQFVDDGIVATLSDVTPFNPTGVIEVLEAAGLPRIGVSPAVQELSSSVTYALDAGGTGTTFMMVPGCARNGHTQIAAIHVDTPQIGPLFDALGPMLDAYGAEIVARIPVAAGTTDYQQFILAAEDAGATCAILPLGENEAVQVLQAAQQLGTDLTFSASSASFGRDNIEELGDFAEQIYFNSSMPPPSASQEDWPILADVVADLSASGDENLQLDTLKTSVIRSWVATYAFVRVIEDFGDPDDISREAVVAAFDAATDVDLFDLVPPWTPTASPAGEGPFSRVSQPSYYIETFADGQFVVDPEPLNVLAQLGGQVD